MRIPENIKVVPFTYNKTIEIDEDFTYTETENRFALADADTGEIFDDAQGYGYTTPQKAYAALGYKRNKASGKKSRIEIAKEWLESNPEAAEKLIRFIEINIKEIHAYSDKYVVSHALKDLDVPPLPKGIGATTLLNALDEI